MNAQQYSGIGGINSYAYAAQPAISQAEQMATAAAQPITQSQIQGYMSPYTQDVVNATQAQFNNQDVQQQQGVLGNAISQGALGGNRSAVAQSELANQQQLAQAPVIAGLENQGYQTGLNTALTEQQAQASGAYSLGNLGVSGQNAALTGANAQIGAGSLEQQTQQAQDTYNYQQYLNAMAYPFQTTQWEAGIDSGIGSQMGGTGTTTAPAPSLLSQFGGAGLAGLGVLGQTGALSGLGSGLSSLGSGAASGLSSLAALLPFSDRRVKENLHKIGKLNDGQHIYRFNYKGDPTTRIGLIAQEVEHHHPDAVREIGGVKAVDYDEATKDAIRKWRGGGVANYDAGGGVAGMPYANGTNLSQVHGFVPSYNMAHGRGAPAPPHAVDPNAQMQQQATQIGALSKAITGAMKPSQPGQPGQPTNISPVPVAQTPVGVTTPMGVAPFSPTDQTGSAGAVYRYGGGVRGYDDGGDVAPIGLADRFSGAGDSDYIDNTPSVEERHPTWESRFPEAGVANTDPFEAAASRQRRAVFGRAPSEGQGLAGDLASMTPAGAGVNATEAALQGDYGSAALHGLGVVAPFAARPAAALASRAIEAAPNVARTLGATGLFAAGMGSASESADAPDTGLTPLQRQLIARTPRDERPALLKQFAQEAAAARQQSASQEAAKLAKAEADASAKQKLQEEISNLPESERSIYAGMTPDQRVDFWSKKAEDKRSEEAFQRRAEEIEAHSRLPFAERNPEAAHALRAASMVGAGGIPYFLRNREQAIYNTAIRKWQSDVAAGRAALEKGNMPSALVSKNMAEKYAKGDLATGSPKMSAATKMALYNAPALPFEAQTVLPNVIDLGNEKTREHAAEQLNPTGTDFYKNVGMGLASGVLPASLGKTLPTINRPLRPPVEETAGLLKTYKDTEKLMADRAKAAQTQEKSASAAKTKAPRKPRATKATAASTSPAASPQSSEPEGRKRGGSLGLLDHLRTIRKGYADGGSPIVVPDSLAMTDPAYGVVPADLPTPSGLPSSGGLGAMASMPDNVSVTTPSSTPAWMGDINPAGNISSQSAQPLSSGIAPVSGVAGAWKPPDTVAAPIMSSQTVKTPPGGGTPMGGGVYSGYLPRGIRNNNPGNIEDGPFARSLPGYAGSDGRFAQFDTVGAGKNAMGELLGKYNKQGIDTVGGVISRWAPASDGNDVGAYASFVAGKIGVRPGDPIDLSDPAVKSKVADAMAQYENGVGTNGSGSATAGVVPSRSSNDIMMPSSVHASSPASSNGVDWSGNGKLWPAMMAAGFGMMASRSPFPGVAIGEGGLQGMSAYTRAAEQEQSHDLKKSEIELEAKKLAQQADQFQQRQALETKPYSEMTMKDKATLAEQQRQHDATIAHQNALAAEQQRMHDIQMKKLETQIDQGNYTLTPGKGPDPTTGENVDGSYILNKKTGETQFKPGMIQEAKAPTLATARSPEARDITARRVIAGDISAKQNVGRGAQGDATLKEIDNDVAKILTDPDGEYKYSTQQAAQFVADQNQDFAAGRAGKITAAKTAAQREENLNLILRAADAAIPAALEASEKVWRTGWVPINQIVQKGEVIASNPELKEFGMANLQLAEHWARAMNPTGVMRESDRDKALEFLSTADSPETYRRAVMQLQKQITRERDSIHAKTTSAPPAAATPASTSSPTTTPYRVRQNGHTYERQTDGSMKAID